MVSLNGTNVVFLGDLGRTGGEHLMQDVNLGALNARWSRCPITDRMV